MPMDIEGWVEVSWRQAGDEPEEDHHWMGVIRLGPIVGGATDDVGAALFGFSKGEVDATVAGQRGVPAHCSAEVRRDLDGIARHEAQYGRGEFGGYTHASWREISRVDWTVYRVSETARAESNWATLFSLMSILEQRYDQIRIVAWWNW